MTATFINTTKHSATLTRVSKTSAGTWDTQEKAGSAWQYNDVNLKYNSATDPDTGDVVYYNGQGTSTNWSNVTKN